MLRFIAENSGGRAVLRLVAEKTSSLPRQKINEIYFNKGWG